MIKAMRPSSVSGKRQACVWIFIFHLSAYVSAANEQVTLKAKDWMWAQCGDNVTLTCDATSLQQWDITIKKFFWSLGNVTMCQYEEDQTEREFQCESTNSSFSRGLTLTLNNVMPTNEGKYLCKLHSTKGSWNTGSQLRVVDCLEGSEVSVNNTHATCAFKGVYPRGEVHWFQGDTNITKDTTSQDEIDKHKFFSVQSTIEMKQENATQPYNCSLWIPALGKYISALEVSSSGTLISLQWICVTATMMLSLMM